MSLLCIGIFAVLSLEIVFGKIASRFRQFDNSNENEIIMNYKYLISEMKASNIEENLRYLTEFPHHPGGKRNTELAKHIAAKWRVSGFDKTKVFPYNIYFSYPKSPGEISLISDGSLKKKLIIENEPSLDASETKGKPLYPFNAFSPKGEVTGEYVYGNYGLENDFETLDKLGIIVSGTIMIFRYGKIPRSDKVVRAESRGAIGVILFTDPSDYSSPGEEYPHGWALNEDGVQRGTINRLIGDALSLGYPSKPRYFRINETKYSGNPKIPSQPISYSSAYELLKFMNDDSISLPGEFQGGLNFTYVLRSGKGRKMKLKVTTELESRESLTVCTTMFGNKEPDRYVMLGSHRDSWVYGASDASSGMATTMEIVRAFGYRKKKTGWRPRRSIMACSWGAEEVGILGSTEWADENHKFIMGHVVAYLNGDIAVHGNFTVNLKALEILRESIHVSAKFVQAPDNPKQSLYEDWCAKSIILGRNKNLLKPKLYTPSSYTDYKSLWHTYGTTIADFRYKFKESDYPGLSVYGQYHTLYDSFGWMKKFVDPNFIHHLAIGQLIAGHSLVLADSIFIPFDLVAYTVQVRQYLDTFDNAYESELKARQISLSFARERLDALIKKAKLFHRFMENINLENTNLYIVRSINDKLMNFERNFLITGISKQLSARHVIYSIISNKIKSTKFPGISEAIYFASKNPNDDWDDVRKQITLVIWCFDTANRSLDIDELKYS